MDGTVALDEALAPTEGRTLYITAGYYKMLKLCDEFLTVEKLGREALARGIVGEFDGMAVKKVPSSYMPKDVYFMIVTKGSAISPMKLNDYKIHSDPPGISGDLVEGRVIFDAFVKGSKAAGIYVAAANGTVSAAPHHFHQRPSGHQSAAPVRCCTPSTAATPATSASAQTYSDAVTVESGDVVRACAIDGEKFCSPVAEKVDEE